MKAVSFLNLLEGVLEGHRDRTPSPAAPFGWSYASLQRLVPPSAVSPLALPSAGIPVADLLP